MNPEFFQALRKHVDFVAYLSEHNVPYRERPHIGDGIAPRGGVEFEIGGEHWFARYCPGNGNFELLAWT